LKTTSDKSNYTLTEDGTDKYADLDMAQTVALAGVAQALVTTLRAERDNGQSKNKQETVNNYDDKK
jgi:hypothetical protein